MTQKVIVWDDTVDHAIRSGTDIADISQGDTGVAGSTGLTGTTGLTGSQGVTGVQGPKGDGGTNSRSDCVSIADTAAMKVVTFSSSLPDTNYSVNATLFNSTDTSPQFQPVTITGKTVGGFTATFNAPVDSANYELCYNASPDGFSFISNTETIAQGATTKTITLSPTLSTSNFVITVNLFNSVDSNPVFQPLTVTSKTTSGFTATWNLPTETANYSLEYHLNLPS